MPDALDRDVHCLLGLPFDAVNLETAVDIIRRSIADRRPCFLSTPNLNWLVAGQSDRALLDSVIASDLSIVDGMPLVWLSGLLGIPIRERVAGSTVFERLMQGGGTRTKVFFFGGQDGAAEAACKRMNENPSGAIGVGFENPGFGSVEDMSSPAIIDRINASGADFVVVSLGAKKGQAWIMRNRSRLQAPAVSHLGAVVNFVAGTVGRAPSWLQRCGGEWLWRIKEEPSLWRRYFHDGLGFLRLLLTKALPLAWCLRRLRPSAGDIAGAQAQVKDGDDGIEVALAGPWCGQNLSRLRAVLAPACRAGKDIRIDVSAATYGDTAFLGLLILLHAEQTKQGRRLSLVGMQGPLARIARYSCLTGLFPDRQS